MKYHPGFRYLVFFFILCVYGCGESKSTSTTITIATAANMQFAMEALIEKFTEETHISCELAISSSGKLTAQIKEGAPYDIFVSANMKYPNELHLSDHTEGAPKIYAYGKLVLWTMASDLNPNIESLTNKNIAHIALANPKSAPYGKAAIEILEHYGIKNQVLDKLVYGESIAQTNQFITSKSAEMGFTAMSVVTSPKIKGQGKWLAMNTDYHTPIAQGAVRIKHPKNHNTDGAKQFYEFLFSKRAKDILKEYGYTINE